MTDVASPCVDVCRMNAQTGFCDGCFRTLDEIASWSSLSDDDKRAVLERVESRRQGARVVVLGESIEAPLALPSDSIRHFATLVGDTNPLHHDDAYARASCFASGTQPTAHFSQHAQLLGLEFGIKLMRTVKDSASSSCAPSKSMTC